MNATIKDVAKLAGVSVATVSRVLNSSASVSEDTAKQVNYAIDSLGYKPNFLGRNLRKCQTYVILAIIPSTEQTYYSEILHGMQNKASEFGYDILMSTSHSHEETELRLLNMLENRTVDAAILMGTKLNAEKLNEISEKANIALCCEHVEGANILSVGIDNEKASYDAINYFIKKGHKNIAMVSTDVRSSSSVLRENGYFKALAENNIEFKPEYLYQGSYDYQNGGYALEGFYKLEEKPTAIFAVSDLIAVGAIIKANEMGIKVGKDIDIMGFDNVSLTEMFIPTISTVEQPCFYMGCVVIEKVIENLTYKNKNKGKCIVNHKLVLRQSTGE
jgi:LacI family transcriptional regulator, repressor for deo operon, udp, cdd, tsx, nupC, and nupG